MKKGKNILSAVVWNFGTLSPYFQMSSRTGFLVQGNSETEEIVNTDNTWKSFHNKAYRGIPIDSKEIPFFCVVGPGDYIKGNDYPWGWKTTEFDDSSWEKSNVVGPAHAKDT